MRAIRIAKTGGPEVLELADVATPTAGPGQILIRHQAIGVNFIDTYHRSGLYPMALPSGLGLEAAGTVEAVGPDVGGARRAASSAPAKRESPLAHRPRAGTVFSTGSPTRPVASG